MSGVLDVFKSGSAVGLLEMFLSNPESEFYQSEIARKSDLSRATSLKWLGRLVELNMLLSSRRAKTVFYELNLENPVVRQLKILLNVSKIHGCLNELGDSRAEVYLYGSVARGEDVKESDVDILILGRLDSSKKARFAERAEKATGKEVKLLVMTPVEYSGLIRKDRIFYENVEKNRIRLL